MFKNFLYVSLLTISFISCNAQPEVRTLVNDANAEKRMVTPFTGVDVSNAITLYISQGNEDAVAVSCTESSDTKKVKTEVKNGVLKIYFDNGFWGGAWKDKKVKAYVSIKNPNFISISGASSCKINETINAENLKINISGASNIKGNLKVNNLKIDLSGASSATFNGTTNLAFIDASGASSFKCYDFIIDDCTAEASGASSLNLNVKTKLAASAGGASSIKYIGNPDVVKSDSNGASSIKKKND